MCPDERWRFRIAESIRTQLMLLREARQGRVQREMRLMLDRLKALERLQRRLSCCNARRWQAAGKSIVTQMDSLLVGTPYFIETVRCAIQACNLQVPSLQDVYKDLGQVVEEFGDLEYDAESGELLAATEDIELEGVELSPFEIRLRLAGLPEVDANTIYRINALDPQPAQTDCNVTHPHVNAGRLCTGDAGAPIGAALTSGRICDFFMFVRSVLTNYNPSSPYVPLSNWYGVACYECGHVMSEGSCCYCSRCENTYCDDCTVSCARCDETHCRSCTQECSECECIVCLSCMTICPRCKAELCQTCLEDGNCSCVDEDKENDDETIAEDDETEGQPVAQGPAAPAAGLAVPPEPALLAHRVGQAGVLS